LNLYTYDTETARSLLSEAGYPEGFEVKIIAHESVKLEAQIMKSMLERVGLRVNLHVVTLAEWFRKYFIPLLDKPPEEQEWDLFVYTWQNYHGNPAATFLNFGYIEESDFRWIEYDPIYEEMWKGMAKTVDVDAQEERIRELVKYVYDRAYSLFVYSPISLYAVNKEVMRIVGCILKKHPSPTTIGLLGSKTERGSMPFSKRNFMILIWSLVSLLLFALHSEVEGESTEPRGEIRVVESWRPDINVLGHNVLQYLFEYALDKNELAPSLGVSREWIDETTLEIKLRQGTGSLLMRML
jgi:hypothetical protein